MSNEATLWQTLRLSQQYALDRARQTQERLRNLNREIEAATIAHGCAIVEVAWCKAAEDLASYPRLDRIQELGHNWQLQADGDVELPPFRGLHPLVFEPPRVRLREDLYQAYLRLGSDPAVQAVKAEARILYEWERLQQAWAALPAAQQEAEDAEEAYKQTCLEDSRHWLQCLLVYHPKWLARVREVAGKGWFPMTPLDQEMLKRSGLFFDFEVGPRIRFNPDMLEVLHRIDGMGPLPAVTPLATILHDLTYHNFDVSVDGESITFHDVYEYSEEDDSEYSARVHQVVAEATAALAAHDLVFRVV